MENDIIDPDIMDEYPDLPPGYEPYAPSSPAGPPYHLLNSTDSAQVDAEYENLYNSLTAEWEPNVPSPSATTAQDELTSIDSVLLEAQGEEMHGEMTLSYEPHGPTLSAIQYPLTPADSDLLDSFDQALYSDITIGYEAFPIDSFLLDPNDEDVFSGNPHGIESISTPPPDEVVQDPLSPVSDTALDPALLVDDAALEAHRSQLSKLATNLEYARGVVGKHEEQIKAQLEKLWDDNADLRRRGLRGGTARKNRKDHGAYVKFEETAALGEEFHKHRLDVEKQDYDGRNRQAGLAALSEMFEETHDWILKQLEICEDMIRCTKLPLMEVFSPLVLDKVSDMSAIVFGKPEENRGAQLEDIKGMVAAFFEEYNQNFGMTLTD